MPIKNIVRVPEQVIPAKELTTIEIRISPGFATVFFSDQSYKSVPLTAEQFTQIEDIFFTEVTRDSDLTVEKRDVVEEVAVVGELARPE